MKVQCEQIINDETGEIADEDSWLTVGKVYDVLSVSINENSGIEYRLMADDNYTPALFKANQFKVVCSVLPSNWVANSEPNSYFELAPKSWTQSGFWEEYFDQESNAISIFDTEKEKIISYS